MGKHKHKHQKSSAKRRIHRSVDGAKLLKYAAAGNTKKLRSLFEADGAEQLLNAAVDASGATALHQVPVATMPPQPDQPAEHKLICAMLQACRHGHMDAAALLLRRDANPNAVDTAGNTPGHLAAMHSHLIVLSELIKRAKEPVNLDLLNNAGLSIRDILQLQRQQQSQQQGQGSPTSSQQHRSPTWSARSKSSDEHSVDGKGRGQGAGGGAAATAADAEWRSKLAAEMSDDEGGWGDVFGGPWGGPAPAENRYAGENETAAAAAPADENDDDVWADRLWQDMLDHKRRVAQETAQAKASKSTSRQGFVGDRDTAAQERQRRAAAAATESERILREEQAKDSDWRAAMMRQIDEAALPTKRVTYEQQWATLDSWPASKPITYRDIPWPATTATTAGHKWHDPQQSDIHIDLDKLRTLVFGGATGPATLKAALRKELMRWHPDKFGARFGSRLAVSDRDSILAGVQAVAQQLNALKSV